MFETSKTFNILEGKVPNFTKGDITLAVLVDGEKKEEFPDKNGYKYVGYECNNDAKITWNNETWRALIDTNKPTICTIKFETKKDYFDYGDGSLNIIARFGTFQNNDCVNITGEGGYINNLALYDTTLEKELEIDDFITYHLYTGNYKRIELNGDRLNLTYSENTIIAPYGISEIETLDTVIGNDESIINIRFALGNYGNVNIGDFNLFLDDNYYTLKEAVESEKIKPIVIMNSGDNKTNFLIDNPVNIYNGGNVRGYYPYMIIYFMLNKDVNFKKIKFTNNGRDIVKGYGDVSITKINNKIFYLK